MRLNVLKNNVSTSDMFHCNQTKKMSIEPPSSDSQRNLKRVNYRCNKNKNLITKSTNLNNNRSNSGIRNTVHLKSHQFYPQSNNQPGLQNFHSHMTNASSGKNCSKNFRQSRKLSINQMKTVNNTENHSEAVISVDRSNNYSSFHTNKGTSFKKNYMGNSSIIKKQQGRGKENISINALKIARKDIRGITKR